MDRIDEMVEFTLPQAHERKKILGMYIERYLLEPPGAGTKKVRTEGIEEAEIERAVVETDGFSGRAISKLAFAWQAAAYGTV
jgi:ATPase family AAA domain-containing protein 3A/B